jgi:hypothetical protein
MGNLFEAATAQPQQTNDWLLPLPHNLTIVRVKNLQCDLMGHLSRQYMAFSFIERPDRTTILKQSLI